MIYMDAASGAAEAGEKIMKATTKSGNEVSFIGETATVKGVTFDVAATSAGVKSVGLVKVGGKMHQIDLEFAGADLVAVRAHMQAASDALRAAYMASDDYKIEQERAARRAFAKKIHSGHGDAAAVN
jgi:hypothetical protein